jgi:HTH-type transcriptional regulator/antitoxin HigA
MTTLTEDLLNHWASLRPFLAIRNEQEYDTAIQRLNDLLDEVGENDGHPLYSLLDTLGTLLHVYEEQHVPIPASSGAEALQFLMDEHQLTQSDLPEVGSQGVVSEILNGKRKLNVRQIRELAIRFGISPAVFI